ncbi:hypothetical protein HBP98_00405 [Listeria booriae]|uniref:Two component regulator three Y domain-containing protein n=1 Tax=Listeria booriae TaxID=1552123 RepID=A0A7X1A382_9LIST|nr:hypothetical protein [Listeria booriae]
MIEILKHKGKRIIIKIYMFYAMLFEKKYHGEKCELRYLLFKKRKTKRLLVIFSSYPGKGQKARYNYVIKFSRLRTSRLYILDNFGPGEKGAYYLGENLDFYIEQDVYRLIESVRADLGVEKKHVVTCGSSKGGYAAIYFEGKYNYGASIAGAPQILLGDYLGIKEHQGIFRFIAGNYDEANREYLNNLLLQAVLAKKSANHISIHVSDQEGMYADHVKPFLSFTEQHDIALSLQLGTYTKHSLVGLYFPSFAIQAFQNFFEE